MADEKELSFGSKEELFKYIKDLEEKVNSQSGRIDLIETKKEVKDNVNNNNNEDTNKEEKVEETTKEEISDLDDFFHGDD